MISSFNVSKATANGIIFQYGFTGRNRLVFSLATLKNFLFVWFTAGEKGGGGGAKVYIF